MSVVRHSWFWLQLNLKIKKNNPTQFKNSKFKYFHNSKYWLNTKVWMRGYYICYKYDQCYRTSRKQENKQTRSVWLSCSGLHLAKACSSPTSTEVSTPGTSSVSQFFSQRGSKVKKDTTPQKPMTQVDDCVFSTIILL